MNIEGGNVVLRAIEEEDLPLLQKWGNDPEIQYMLGGWHFPINQNNHKQWHESLNINSVNQRFAIHVNGLGLIGTANLVNIDWKNRNAFHGMLLGDKDIRGKGYAKDTVFALMQYAFEELGLNRLDGSMIEYNHRSIKFYLEKCGWKKEGVQRQWYFRQGKFWDKVIVGITKDEYEQLNKTQESNG